MVPGRLGPVFGQGGPVVRSGSKGVRFGPVFGKGEAGKGLFVHESGLTTTMREHFLSVWTNDEQASLLRAAL